MLPELAPYSFATLVLAAFSLVAVQIRYRWRGAVWLPQALGFLLILSTFHLAYSALIGFGVTLHVLMLWVFAMLVAWGVPLTIRNVATSEPQ